MTKINKPEYYLGNYVDFRFEKIIERHSARGEWKYIPYIKDSTVEIKRTITILF